MPALGAQRTGAGYVQLAVPESAQQAVALRLLEAVTRGLPEEQGMPVPGGVDEVAELAAAAGADRSHPPRGLARAAARHRVERGLGPPAGERPRGGRAKRGDRVAQG